jgi:transcriptional regulator
MYTPRFNQVTDRAVLIELMQANSFAILFGPLSDQAGSYPSVATHLPLVVRDEGAHGIIEGHFARANPHWAALAGQQTLIVFSGPHSYVSPTLYRDPQTVPTWNYIAVHAYGQLELVEGEPAKDALLKGLIAVNEPGYAERWRQLPESFRHGMLAGIVGFRIPIARIEGKFKLSQNRPEEDRRNVRTSQEAGTADQQALAAWMRRLKP